MKDIPIDFRIELLKNLPSTNLTRSKSKCTLAYSKILMVNNLNNSNVSFFFLAMGEPPLVMAFSVVSAVRQAISSARKDAGLSEGWFKLDLPLTPESILMASEVRIEEFLLE